MGSPAGRAALPDVRRPAQSSWGSHPHSFRGSGPPRNDQVCPCAGDTDEAGTGPAFWPRQQGEEGMLMAECEHEPG